MDRNDYLATGELDPALNVATRLHAHPVSVAAAHADVIHADEPPHRASSELKDEKASISADSDSKDVNGLGYNAEKKANVEDVEDLQETFTAEDLARGIPFPENSLPYEEGNGLTVRALVTGTGLGFIIAASNLYLGLKTGFTFAATLFGSILGFVIVKFLSRTLPAAFGGGFFGPRENVTIQSAAAGASGLTSMFVAAVPAMYRLGLLNNPKADFARLFTFTFCSAFYAVFFAIPLRKFYILKQKLVFPTPTATALAIRAMHTAGGAALARKKTSALCIAFGVSIVYCVANTYVSGILLDQHIFYWLYTWGWRHALYVDNWGWYTTITPAFFGSGMLAGMNASWSFLGGLFLGYGMIGPSLVASGEAKCVANSETEPLAYTCFSTTQYNPNNPAKSDIKGASPRYWLIWPAVLMMFGYSFAEVAMNYKSLWAGLRSATMDMYSKVTGKEVAVYEEAIPDPAPKSEQISMIYVLGGVAASVVMTVLVCALQFDMNAGNVILAIVLAFLFSFIGIQSSGTTDINPLSSVAKASQLIVGGAVKGQGKTGNPALLENLLAGSIASSAAAHSVDMVGDLKTGHWLRASPKSQFFAQLFGSLFAAPLSVGLFVLFAEAYPCVLEYEQDGTCVFGAPSVAAWQAVAQAVVAPKLPISLSSGVTAIVLTVVAILSVVARYKFIPAKYHVYMPNWNAIGIGFLVPNCNYGISMATGATFVYFWARKYPHNADVYAYAVAAGMVAGEGIAGVINAILEIAGVSGAILGSTVGLPPW